MAVVMAVGACGGERLSDDGTDGAAVGVCRDAVNSNGDWSSTVRDDDADGFVVNVWRQSRPLGEPDYVCKVRREPDEPGGVKIAEIMPSPSP
jgi:hypothetical protein